MLVLVRGISTTTKMKTTKTKTTIMKRKKTCKLQ